MSDREPLLAKGNFDGDDAAAATGAPGGAGGGRVAPRRREKGCFEQLCPCCLAAVRPAEYDDFATAEQMTAIRALRAQILAPYVADSEEALSTLAGIWRAAYPDGDATPGPVDPAWKRVGFQSSTPASDVRGAGIFGMRLLCRLVESDEAMATAMRRSEAEYPFAACALNVGFVLIAHLRVVENPKFCPCCGSEIANPPPHKYAMQGLAGLLARDADAFFGVYSLAMHVLEAEYREAKRRDASFGLLGFGQVLAATRRRVMGLLEAQPRSVAELRDRAGVFVTARADDATVR